MDKEMIKALRCLGSQSCMGDCYADVYNYKNRFDVKAAYMCCGEANKENNWIGCPYYQSKYETCIDDGCEWLDKVADILEGKTGDNEDGR